MARPWCVCLVVMTAAPWHRAFISQSTSPFTLDLASFAVTAGPSHNPEPARPNKTLGFRLGATPQIQAKGSGAWARNYVVVQWPGHALAGGLIDWQLLAVGRVP